MSGPQYFEDPVSGTAVPGQAPIDVFADDDGAVVIHQFQWREGEVCIAIRPEFAFGLCREILEAAGFDPDTVLREVAVKDAHAAERQRRRREKLRDCHGAEAVTVTAKPAQDMHEHKADSGNAG
jgi:hypothetical protein